MDGTRRLLGREGRAYIKPNSVEVWIGISTDEASRMKPARQQYMKNKWPLVEKDMSRTDCEIWLRNNGYPVQRKSACIGCPFRSNDEWRYLRDNCPEEWADAVLMDKALRLGDSRGMRGVEFMHRDRVPLDEVDLDAKTNYNQLNLFKNECEGMCGL